MNPQLWWYLARSTGIIAWALLTASMIWGLLLSTRLLQQRPTPKWLLDLHRHLGGLALAFTALHLATLWADSYVEFTIADLLIPFAADWQPGPVALGIIGLYLLAAVEATSLAMKRLPRRWWRRIHLTSYPLFWIATLHGITAGTDATHPAYWTANTLAAATIVFLTLYRTLAGRRARKPRPGPQPTAAARPTSADSEAANPPDRPTIEILDTRRAAVEADLQAATGDASLCSISRTAGSVPAAKYLEGRLSAIRELRRALTHTTSDTATVIGEHLTAWQHDLDDARQHNKGPDWIAYRAGGVDELAELADAQRHPIPTAGGPSLPSRASTD